MIMITKQLRITFSFNWCACKAKINVQNKDNVITRCIPRYDWFVVGFRIYAAHIIFQTEERVAAIKSVDHTILYEYAIAWRQIYA